MRFRSMPCWLLVILSAALAFPAGAAGKAKHFVLVVWDGMRPDFVSPELTPTLHALRSNGVWFAKHHSVYPTSTEVNGTVLATGVFPQRSGVTANLEYRQAIDPLKEFGTQSLKAVRRGDELTGGKYLGVPTLAEALQAAGFTTAIAGAKPVVFLHDRRERADDAKGRIWFAEGALPASQFATLTNRLGAFPAAATPNVKRDQWTTRALVETLWANELPRYSVLWLSEPDYSQHNRGVGSREALAGISHCDRQLASVLAELERRGVRDQTDIMVVSDHGFSTITSNWDAAGALRKAGINASERWERPPTNGDVTVVGNGGSTLYYVTGQSPDTIKKVVATLQRQPSSGVIFTRDGLPGTFTLSEAMLASPTAPDVMVAMRWTMPAFGSLHTTAEIYSTGYRDYRNGMHVTLSPTDVHNLAVASGPDFRRGITNDLPSGNIDIVPTWYWLMDLKPAATLDGRVLSEALAVTAPAVGTPKPGSRDTRIEFPDGTWEQCLRFTELDGVRYLDEGNGTWHPAAK